MINEQWFLIAFFPWLYFILWFTITFAPAIKNFNRKKFIIIFVLSLPHAYSLWVVQALKMKPILFQLILINVSIIFWKKTSVCFITFMCSQYLIQWKFWTCLSPECHMIVNVLLKVFVCISFLFKFCIKVWIKCRECNLKLQLLLTNFFLNQSILDLKLIEPRIIVLTHDYVFFQPIESNQCNNQKRGTCPKYWPKWISTTFSKCNVGWE